MKASSIIMQEKIYLSPRQGYGRDYGSRLMGNILSAPSRFGCERVLVSSATTNDLRGTLCCGAAKLSYAKVKWQTGVKPRQRY